MADSQDRSKTKGMLFAALGFLIPMAASHVARGALGKGYERIARRKPPKNPAARDVPWKEAFAWALAAGFVGGIAKLATRRILAPSSLLVEQDSGRPIEDSE